MDGRPHSRLRVPKVVFVLPIPGVELAPLFSLQEPPTCGASGSQNSPPRPASPGKKKAEQQQQQQQSAAQLSPETTAHAAALAAQVRLKVTSYIRLLFHGVCRIVLPVLIRGAHLFAPGGAALQAMLQVLAASNLEMPHTAACPVRRPLCQMYQRMSAFV